MDIKKEAIKLLAISLGYVSAAFLLAIGIELVIKEIWIGILIIILGYEQVRRTFIFFIKSLGNDTNKKKLRK